MTKIFWRHIFSIFEGELKIELRIWIKYLNWTLLSDI